MISASLQACGVVFPLAISTSICRSKFTICSGLYLFTEEAIAEISLEDLLSADKDGLQEPGQWPSAGNGGSMNADPLSALQSTDPVQTSEKSPPEQNPSRSIPDAGFENVAISDESGPAAESESAEADDNTGPSQDEAMDANDDRQPDKQPALQVVPPSPQTGSGPIEIDFRQLENGRRLELIEDPTDPTKTKLAVFGGSKVQLVSHFEYRGNIFLPIARESDGLSDIVLPHAPNPYHSTEEVLSRVVHLLESCLSLAPSYLNILATFVLYSWFADQLQPPVYLIITGPPESGKTTLLEAMRLLCRRSILVGEITAAALLDVCSRFAATLLIDENDWEADRSGRVLRKQLRTGTSSNLLAKHLHKTQKAFGAKILSSPDLPDDPALRGRCVHIPISETDRLDLHKPWDPKIMKAADDLQGSLLQLRLEKYGSIAWRLVPGAERLRPRSRDLLGSLLAALPRESAAEKSLLEFFLEVHNPATRNLLSPSQHAVVAALFSFVHLFPEAGKVQVGQIAEFANESLKASGERFGLTPRKVSVILESLGFGEIHRSNRGSERTLNQEAIQKIHRLTRDHSVGVIDKQDLKARILACELCRSFFSKKSMGAKA